MSICSRDYKMILLRVNFQHYFPLSGPLWLFYEPFCQEGKSGNWPEQSSNFRWIVINVVQSFQMTDDQDYLFPDASLLCETGNCAPPTFNIPPPPRPPWMEELEDCNDNQNQKISEWLSEVHSCDNTLIRDSQTYFEDTFHSIAIIVVSAIILVIIFLAFGLYLFR